MIFGAGPILIQQVGQGIFSASGGAGARVNFLSGTDVTITTVTPTGLGLQSSPGSNTTFDLQQNSRVSLNGYQGVNLGHSPAGTVNTLAIGQDATLQIRTAPVSGGPVWAKGVMLSSNAAVTLASRGLLDVQTTGGQYARGVELGTSLTYPDAFDRRFTASAGSTLRIRTSDPNSDGFYMLGAGEAVMNGTTDIQTTGNDSSGIYLYQYLSPSVGSSWRRRPAAPPASEPMAWKATVSSASTARRRNCPTRASRPPATRPSACTPTPAPGKRPPPSRPRAIPC
ncbi:hypothetical protein WJ971_18080 [Achromobacter xylosoxidans]